MSTTPAILAFSGSSRRESLNKKLLTTVVAEVQAVGGTVTVLDLKELPMPLYDGDLEDASGLPDNARKMIDLIVSHQGLLIASPEYNSMMTPLLKNTIDWCTRADDNPFLGKIAAVVSASPGNFGGIRSMTQVRSLLTHLGCHVIPEQCILPQADKAFDASGHLTSTRTKEAAVRVARSLVALCRKLQ
jgi:chromate reductase, NAD(P)H dehydrogenase (quinone)